MAQKTARLSKTTIQRGLKKLEGWKLNAKGTAVFTTFTCADFKTALRLVNKIGKLAEEANHHPDVLLSYGKVKVTLSTHSVGGLTQKDFDLAEHISRQMKK